MLSCLAGAAHRPRQTRRQRPAARSWDGGQRAQRVRAARNSVLLPRRCWCAPALGLLHQLLHRFGSFLIFFSALLGQAGFECVRKGNYEILVQGKLLQDCSASVRVNPGGRWCLMMARERGEWNKDGY